MCNQPDSEVSGFPKIMDQILMENYNTFLKKRRIKRREAKLVVKPSKHLLYLILGNLYSNTNVC